MFQRIYSSIFSPMPLNDFDGYDAYWAQRITDGVPDVLPRFVWIASRIPEGASVVDVGCGNGAFLAYLKSRNPALSLFGVDIAEAAVTCLKQHGINGARIDGTKSLRNLVGHDVDIAVVMEVLEHVDEAEALFNEVLALNPKRIFVTIPNAGYLIHRLRLMFGGRFPVTSIAYHVKEHLRFWTVKDFRQWAAAMGCDVTMCVGQEWRREPLRRFLTRRFPALFAAQVIFEVVPKTR